MLLLLLLLLLCCAFSTSVDCCCPRSYESRESEASSGILQVCCA
jgi:hypothetical protein